MVLPLTETEHAVLLLTNILLLGGMLIWAFWHLEQQLKQKPKGRFSWHDYAGTSPRPLGKLPAKRFHSESSSRLEKQALESELSAKRKGR
jgi:hypothetical protein